MTWFMLAVILFQMPFTLVGLWIAGQLLYEWW